MTQNLSKKVVCLMGPTASGKTPLAIELLKHFPFELISVDSAMVYRGMDIGTAKPEPQTLEAAPHALIDLRDPLESYSAGNFCDDAMREIRAIHARGNVPLLVGGTMMYFRALQFGLANLPKADEALRAQLQREIQADGLTALYRRLQQVDPDAAANIDPNDSQRIQRALEVYALSGKPISEWQRQNRKPLEDYAVFNMALAPKERKTLHDKIAQRFDLMMQHGFLKEVEALYQRGDLHAELPSMRSVGYRQVWSHLVGEVSAEEAREKAIAATRQLAKRQLTWLRSWPDIHWYESDAGDFLSRVREDLEMFLRS